MTTPLNHRQHLRSLDGLRGAAVLAVFFFHYYPRSPHDPVSFLAGLGWLGVDLFFLLSGFLITGILYDTRREPQFFRNFYARRALRLFPVYLLIVALVLAVTYAERGHATIAALPFLLYGSNIVGDLGLATGLTLTFQLGHLWSLALEEQFYLLWPPVLLLLGERRRIFWACVAGIVLSITLRWLVLQHVTPHYSPYIELPTRLDGLLGGGLLALLLRSERGVAALGHNRRLYAGQTLGAAVLLACVLRAHTAHWSSLPMGRFGYTAAALVFFCTVTLALRQGTWVERVGDFQPLRTLGRYSYGFYLWHQLPENFFRGLMARCAALLPMWAIGRTLGFALAFVLCFGIAVASYHLVELPFLQLKRRFAYRDEKRVHRVRVDADEVEAA